MRKSQLKLVNDPLFGWWSHEGDPAPMDVPHRHNELELNLVEQGAVVYLFPGRRVEIPARKLFFFWSAVPHQLISREEGTHIHWMTIPLADVLRWELPEKMLRSVLAGRPAVCRDERYAEGDMAAFRRWHEDLETGDAERKKTLVLELEARLRRLGQDQDEAVELHVVTTPSARGETLARYLSEHFLEEWTVGDAAGSAGLHPNYAMLLFRRVFGVSMVEYATQLRIAKAQQLLVTSEMDITTIAYECGFGSSSRFYAAFRAVTGATPRGFREGLRWK